MTHLQDLNLFSKQLDGEDNKAKDEYKQAYAVDAVHIPDPFAFGPVGIFLLKIKIFGYLTPDSHRDHCWANLNRKECSHMRFKTRG